MTDLTTLTQQQVPTNLSNPDGELGKAVGELMSDNNKNNLLEILQNPPKCPSCRTVGLKPTQVERNELIEGGTVHWRCPVCEFKLVRAFN
jgi:hypothetical protein